MIEAFGSKLLDWGIPKAFDLVFDQTSAKVQERLNQDEVQGAIALQYPT